MKQVMTKPLSHRPFPTFSYQLPKIYLHFQNKNLQWNQVHLTFLLTLYPLNHLIISPRMLLNRKTQRTVSEEIREDEIKQNEI